MFVFTKLTNIGEHTSYMYIYFSEIFYHHTFLFLFIDEKTRVQSGCILDANIKTHFHLFPAKLVASLKSECLSALDDPSPVIRETAFSLIKTISFKIGKLADWPDMVPRVCQMLNSKEKFDSEGAFDVLHFISQEYALQIAMIDELHKELIPKFAEFLTHTSPIIRLYWHHKFKTILLINRDLNHFFLLTQSSHTRLYHPDDPWSGPCFDDLLGTFLSSQFIRFIMSQ